MSTRWIMLGSIAWASFGAYAGELPAAISIAESELRRRLLDAYPDVASWTLTPMLSERQRAALATHAEVHIDSVRLGRRSALQVSWREGERRRRQPVWFDVSGQQPAWLLNGDVKRNGSIAADVLRPDQAAEWDPGCSVVAPSAPVEGMRARKALRGGDPLCGEDMEPKPPVSRGERVLVHSSAGLVTVVVDGIAEQDGNVGDRLQIRNPQSGELYFASVSAEGEVIVRQ